MIYLSKRTCQHCGDEFFSQRSSAKFCKPAHRTAYNRLPTRIEKQMNAAMDRIWDIDHIANDHPDTIHLAIAAMQAAEDYIEDNRLRLLQQVREQSGGEATRPTIRERLEHHSS